MYVNRYFVFPLNKFSTNKHLQGETHTHTQKHIHTHTDRHTVGHRYTRREICMQIYTSTPYQNNKRIQVDLTHMRSRSFIYDYFQCSFSHIVLRHFVLFFYPLFVALFLSLLNFILFFSFLFVYHGKIGQPLLFGLRRVAPVF